MRDGPVLGLKSIFGQVRSDEQDSGHQLPVPAHVRGQAYLMAHNGPAAAESQKLLDHRGIVVNFVTGALAHLQIGRAYAMAGDTARAKAAYQKFFNIWKDADAHPERSQGGVREAAVNFRPFSLPVVDKRPQHLLLTCTVAG